MDLGRTRLWVVWERIGNRIFIDLASKEAFTKRAKWNESDSEQIDRIHLEPLERRLRDALDVLRATI